MKKTKQVGKCTLEINEVGRVSATDVVMWTTVVTANGMPHVGLPDMVTWEILDAARELRREWDARPRCPKGWREGQASVSLPGYPAEDYREAIVIHRDDPHTVVVHNATPDQCAQISAAQAYLMSEGDQ